VLCHDRVFDRGGFFFERGREVVGDGLCSCPYSRHRRQRSLLQPAFHPDRIASYTQVITDRISAVTGSWQHGQILDVIAEMTTMTATTTAATLFADTLPSPLLHQTLEDLTTIVASVFRRMLMPSPLDRLPTPGNRRYHHAKVRLRQSLTEIITARNANTTHHRDLLGALLSARDPEGNNQGLSETEILDQVVTFFLAGTETTASTLAWALHLLAQHPDIRAQLHTELDTVLAGHPATHADLPQLELTSRVIRETLRLWPPGWMFTRIVTADSDLGGHHLPAGTTIIVSPYLIHHHPDLYEHPDRFDPDRWLPEAAHAIPRHAYIPFGGGARKCIGDTFALTEAYPRPGHHHHPLAPPTAPRPPDPPRPRRRTAPKEAAHAHHSETIGPGTPSTWSPPL
jgi:cytochrome P450